MYLPHIGFMFVVTSITISSTQMLQQSHAHTFTPQNINIAETNTQQSRQLLILSSSLPIQLSVGVYHTCILFNNSQVNCWGRNSVGQLGTANNDNSNKGDEQFEMCALKSIDFGTNFIPKEIHSDWEYH